jgi:hypothetical protein
VAVAERHNQQVDVCVWSSPESTFNLPLSRSQPGTFLSNSEPPACRTPIARLRSADCLQRDLPKHEFEGNSRQDDNTSTAAPARHILTNMADIISTEMQSFASRVATFQQPHQLTKRRASSQGKKKTQQTTEWPHEHPSPEEVC